jgi:hypothetical protein
MEEKKEERKKNKKRIRKRKIEIKRKPYLL